MSKFSDTTETNILNAIFKNIAFPIPTNIYLALFTADPTDTNVTANEVQTSAWGDYVRKDAAAGGGLAAGWTSPSGGGLSNAVAITFPANNGSSITITHIGLYDALTGGNLLFHGQLTNEKTLLTSDVLSFAIGAVTVQLN